MRGEDGLVIGHPRETVGNEQSLVIADAKPHRPHRGVETAVPETKVELPQGEIRGHRFIDLRHRNGRHFGQNFADVARQIPTRTEFS